MKELYELVLKTIEESDKSEIFYRYHYRNRDMIYLTSVPTDNIENYTNHYESNIEYSETSYKFGFFFKYKDGEPNIEVELLGFKTTEKKSESITTGYLWWKKVKTKTTILKSHPVYEIVAGELKYETSIEESRKLHKAYSNLIERDKNSVMKKQEQQIKDRLSGKVKLDLND